MQSDDLDPEMKQMVHEELKEKKSAMEELTGRVKMLLMPSALVGNTVAVVSIAVYSAVMGAYVVLRSAKALADRRAEATAPATELDLETAAAA